MFDRKAWAKAYYAKNKERLQAKQREWAAANKDSIAERKRMQRSGNVTVAEKKRAWQQANVLKVAEYNKKWKQANRDRHNALGMKRHAAKMNRTPPWLTKEHFTEIKEFYIVAKLMTERTGIPYEVDHIVPLQGETVSGLHVPWNLQVIKRSSNRAKRNHLS